MTNTRIESLDRAVGTGQTIGVVAEVVRLRTKAARTEVSRLRLHSNATVIHWPILGTLLLFAIAAATTGRGAVAAGVVDKIGTNKGICVVVGLEQDGKAESVLKLARESDLLIYFQSPNAEEVAAVRKGAESENLLGLRVYADRGDLSSIHLADNVADAVIVAPTAKDDVMEEELLRVLRPDGKVLVGDRQIVKPVPDGIDAWSHPYHGPDNNPQSTDELARAPYLTQFLAEPLFAPMPEVSVAAGGRVFRAFGHIAHKANQNKWLNTLICANAYNGTILWKRKLTDRFMIHRNAMIATPEFLYLADDKSCKRIDAKTGKVVDEITFDGDELEGTVCKWMALQGGILYALVGGPESPIATKPSNVRGLGHWPWGMWDGHNYADPKTSFGFGRTFVAIDAETKKTLWTHREEDYLDSRGVCMRGDRLYFYSPEKLLGCLNTKNAETVWKTSAADLLQAIGPNGRAQHYVTGYSTTTYIKCNDDYILFAGPQRSRLVVASAADGRLLWQRENGNLQLVLRDDGFYAAGPADIGCKFDYATGEILARLPRRRACTRATGTLDSIFYRTPGGTVRVQTPSNTAQHIAPMRPPCQDGVIISDGNLYWGSWMCGCQLSLYGHICLTSGLGFEYRPGLDSSRLEDSRGPSISFQLFEVRPGDWPTYCGDNERSMVSDVALPETLEQKWNQRVSSGDLPTAPVVAGGLVFVADRNGVVKALDASDGTVRWQAYTAGPIYFPPAVDQESAFVGSADGHVYAFEAATGKQLWRFRAAPADHKIPVYGKLISRWPVAGGVVVQDGVVYAAAGIAHYDGTHVYALDAATGQVKWYNDSSGAISEQVNCGASLQGNLHIRDGELRFLAGGAYETARYDLKTGECLNAPHDGVNSRFHTSFYAHFPEYGKYLSLDHTLEDGRSLVYDASYEGSQHSLLALQSKPVPGAPRVVKPASRWPVRRRGQAPATSIWQDKKGRRFNAFVVTDEVLLGAGEAGSPDAPQALLAIIRLDDGSDLTVHELPAPAVKGGLAVDHDGRVFVTLENGQMICLASEGG